MSGAPHPTHRRRADEGDGELVVELDWPLPAEIAVGAGSALCLGGRCFHRRQGVTGLEVVVDGIRRPVTAHGMPRLDYFRELHPGLDPYDAVRLHGDPGSAADPELRGYRSGFWALVPILPRDDGGVCELGLVATLAGGGEAAARLGSVPRATLPEPLRRSWAADSLPAPPPPSSGSAPPLRSSDPPLVAVCLATHNPPADLLVRQLESIRAQTHDNWICVISDDCSAPAAYARLEAAVSEDQRFLLSRAPRRLGFYHNFERALALAPAEARYVAMADQDDYWYPEKLAKLVRAIGPAQLACSDARVVARDGSVISDTWWSRRRNNHTDLLSLLVANSVTGAASLFPRSLLDDALPFPPGQFAHFHDHWVGLVALARGEVRFLEEPLYDYVQHGTASLGHAAANRMTGLLARLQRQRSARERARMWRMHYFVDVLRLRQFAMVLDLRCRTRMSAGKRRALDRFDRAERSLPAFIRLGARGVRDMARERPETLGAEWMLFCGFLWRRLLTASARERPQRRLRLDAVPPPTLLHAPGRAGLDGSVAAVADKVAPLALAVREQAPRRVNVLIPTIDLEHFFGGYIAKLNLARRLAERGERVRVVTVDPVGRLPRGWQRTVQSYGGLAGLFDRVELAFGRESGALEVSPLDAFVASTWWTAQIAHRATRSLAGERFVYLIQEFEPFTFAMGTYAALAEQSYRLPHFAMFSTELLRGYFRAHGIGVYAGGTAAGDAASASFQNAITPVSPPSLPDLRRRDERRLLFYARPEAHAARNMFELGALALSAALERGTFAGWELNGIGTVNAARRIGLGGGAQLSLLPRAEQAAYAELLREHDVGLALMYTPHPSLVPIEMASGGMVTVTNRFENKTPEAMAAISGNLITAEPSIEAIAAALDDAAARAQDYERRVQGSRVAWSTDWDESFDDALLARVTEALRR
ncbi:MAG: glycosyltransferase [Solirubrobacterales bacterium]|nr:glycosyltransferase [Solirubrobacterales bacterium]MBV9714925.1 glycosyltransferase [Solirubrobacterales bacterium]